MDLKWEYHTENFGSDNVVATLYKRNHIPVLQVYEGGDCYFSRPFSEYRCYIDQTKIPYSDADSFVESQKAIIPADKESEEKVKYVCALFEDNFKKQVNKILNLFS